jgi:two-component system LytT family sensor kinase
LAALLASAAGSKDTILDVDASRTSSQSPPWFWIAAIWCGIGLFDATQTVIVMRAEGMHHAWAGLFVTLLLSWLPWALATPLVLREALFVLVKTKGWF